MLFSSALVALSLLAAVLPAEAAGLHRKRCKAKTPAPSGAALNVGADPTSSPNDAPDPSPSGSSSAPSGCFPSKSFDVPDSPKGISINDWWCDRSSEYAFMGFGYAVDSCPSQSTMKSAFTEMKSTYGARYVRTYGGCDKSGFSDDLVNAAYESGIGVFALVWFGFKGDDSYKGRLADLMSAVNNNTRSAYTIRTITIGSEAMFDSAISTSGLVSVMNSVRSQVKSMGIQVTTSDMVNQFQNNPSVAKAVDHGELSVLPFFSGTATTGSKAGGQVTSDTTTMAKLIGGNKKVFMMETGWPSNTDVWKANSGSAVASVSSEKSYFDLLDSMCSQFKAGPAGGYGWFAQIWDDNSLPGWGITQNGQAKFDFSPRTKC